MPDDEAEVVVKLPNASPEVFGLAQNFMYSGRVFPEGSTAPDYELTIGVWKLGNQLGINGLCDSALDAMVECRKQTGHIPATLLLIQVWKDTPEGSSLRKLLVSWTAEYMRRSETRAQYARSLPQEVLSELVVAMSSLDDAPANPVAPQPSVAVPRKNVHYLEDDEESEEDAGRVSKKQQRLSLPSNNVGTPQAKASAGSAGVTSGGSGRKPGPKPKPAAPKPRRSSGVPVTGDFTEEQKLTFCDDLLTRMLSGPGKASHNPTMLVL